MLVHINLCNPSEDYDDWDYEHTKTISARKIKQYDKFIRFIKALKKYKKPLIVDDEWYDVLDYAYSFPSSKDSLPCFYIYVCEH